MALWIVGDDPSLMQRLRSTLAALGHDCPPAHVLATHQAVTTLASGAVDAKTLFFVMSGAPDQACLALGRIRSITAARIVAVGSAHDPHAILEALQAGADYFIDENDSLENGVIQALTRRSTSPRSEHTGRLITITAASGGVGRTLLAANLGIALAQRGGNCGLLDFSSGFGTLADHLNLQPRHTLDDLLRNGDLLDRDVFSQSLTPHASGVSLLAAGAEHEELEEADADTLDRVVQIGRQVLGTCILDIDHHVARRCHALQHSDAIVFVVRPDFASLCGARRLLDDWERRQIDRSHVMFVANRCGQAVEIPVKKVESILGEKISLCIEDDPVLAGVTVNCGNPAVLESPASRFAKSLFALAEMVRPAEDKRAPQTGEGPSDLPHKWLQRAASVLFC